jgi:hypothetical protein
MILRSAQVRDYKSITDSGEAPIEATVTCLVGKNESGKTAFLEALYRLNPLATGHRDHFEALYDYPRVRYSREKEDAGSRVPIRATFELDAPELALVEEQCGPGVLGERTITVSRRYDGTRLWSIPVNERARIDHLVAEHGAKPGVANGCETIGQLREKLTQQAQRAAATEQLLGAISELEVWREIADLLEPHLPRFLYFDEYSQLPGIVNIATLAGTPGEELDPGMRTALALLRLAGASTDEFAQDTYEARRAELEAAGSAITDEVFEYWSQNEDLRVVFDVYFTPPEHDPTLGDEPHLNIRVENRRHHVTLNFGERSAGFVWFFSFLTAFSEYRNSDEALILLLDEPGLGLHATAQGDLLRYIDERLGPNRQMIYTTHSPFMVDPAQLDRVRAVEDKDGRGTQITSEVMQTSADTLFPLQAALGYELVQTLFVGPDNLVVEGPSDLLYLTTMSEHLRNEGREGLDPRWVIVPVGGIDKIPTFIALLGAHLNVAVVLDSAAGGSQKVNSMIEKGVIESKSILPLASITGRKEADIEDLFDESWYIALLKASGAASVTKAQLGQGDRIVRRIESVVGSFDHYQPAAHLLREQRKHLPRLPPDSLDRFEALFQRANALLP